MLHVRISADPSANRFIRELCLIQSFVCRVDRCIVPSDGILSLYQVDGTLSPLRPLPSVLARLGVVRGCPPALRAPGNIPALPPPVWGHPRPPLVGLWRWRGAPPYGGVDLSKRVPRERVPRGRSRASAQAQALRDTGSTKRVSFQRKKLRLQKGSARASTPDADTRTEQNLYLFCLIKTVLKSGLP